MRRRVDGANVCYRRSSANGVRFGVVLLGGQLLNSLQTWCLVQSYRNNSMRITRKREKVSFVSYYPPLAMCPRLILSLQLSCAGLLCRLRGQVGLRSPRIEWAQVTAIV